MNVVRGDGGDTTTFRPTVVAVQPGRLVRWRGTIGGGPWAFVAVHEFRVEPDGRGGTVFVQAERFRGALLPLFDADGLLPGFVATGRALATRAEGCGGLVAGCACAVR